MNRIGKRLVTQREVAGAAGVHPSTVSLALRNDARLLPETKDRVRAAAERMGYACNPLVSLLMARVRRSNVDYRGTIAFIRTAPPEFLRGNDPLGRNFLSGARARAGELGYELREFHLGADGGGPASIARVLAVRNVDGVIVVHVPGPACPDGRLPFDLGGYPAVSIGAPLLSPALNSVANDQYMRPIIAARELLALGYRRLGLVIEERFDRHMAHRCSAGFWAVQCYVPGLESIPILRVGGPEAAGAVRRWVLRHRPDAVLAPREWILDAIRSAGVAVPGEVGWALLEWLPQCAPSAGVYGNSELTGRAALDEVVGQIYRGERGPPARPSVHLVAGSWMHGNTVRCVGPPVDLNGAFFAEASPAAG